MGRLTAPGFSLTWNVRDSLHCFSTAGIGFSWLKISIQIWGIDFPSEPFRSGQLSEDWREMKMKDIFVFCFWLIETSWITNLIISNNPLLHSPSPYSSPCSNCPRSSGPRLATDWSVWNDNPQACSCRTSLTWESCGTLWSPGPPAGTSRAALWTWIGKDVFREMFSLKCRMWCIANSVWASFCWREKSNMSHRGDDISDIAKLYTNT